MASGSTRSNVPAGFGETVLVMPKATHLATIVWLHDVDENGDQAAELVKRFSLNNVKWICPTASLISSTGSGEAPKRAWFKVDKICKSMKDDLEGLNLSAKHVAEILKDEQGKGVAGYGIGGALALHVATCYALRSEPIRSHPIKLQAVVGINTWLPYKINLDGRINSASDARARALGLPILLSHANDDKMVPYDFGRESAECLRRAGFENIDLKTIPKSDHAIVFQTVTEVRLWLTRKLELA